MIIFQVVITLKINKEEKEDTRECLKISYCSDTRIKQNT
jgi:hypothetical protein